MKTLFLAGFLLWGATIHAQVYKKSAEGGLSLVSSYRILSATENATPTAQSRDSREVPIISYRGLGGF